MTAATESGDVAVVIPVLNGARELTTLLPLLHDQTLKPSEILIVDSASDDTSVQVAKSLGAHVHRIERKDFNHGGTRNLGISLTTAPVVVLMTQDAIPHHEDFLKNLTAPLRSTEPEHQAAAAFARQLPHTWAWPMEHYTRAHNYGPTSEHRTPQNRADNPLRSVFFSNVASAVRRDAFNAIGQFPDNLIMNEDQVLAGRLLDAGYNIDYRADALVRHSHNYSLAQSFRRYVDIGVFHADYTKDLDMQGTGGEGLKFVRGMIKHLLKTGHWDQIPYAIADIAARLAGFHLGKRYQQLSKATLRRVCMHKGFW